MPRSPSPGRPWFGGRKQTAGPGVAMLPGRKQAGAGDAAVAASPQPPPAAERSPPGGKGPGAHLLGVPGLERVLVVVEALFDGRHLEKKDWRGGAEGEGSAGRAPLPHPAPRRAQHHQGGRLPLLSASPSRKPENKTQTGAFQQEGTGAETPPRGNSGRWGRAGTHRRGGRAGGRPARGPGRRPAGPGSSRWCAAPSPSLFCRGEGAPVSRARGSTGRARGGCSRCPRGDGGTGGTSAAPAAP